MRDVRALSKGAFILIDRENVKQGRPLTKDQSEGVYVLEIVSQQHSSIPTGRYLRVNSRAKDAADTLIVILLS